MSAIDNLGGFAASSAKHPYSAPGGTSPASTVSPEAPLIDLTEVPAQQPIQPDISNARYPSYAPPSYDTVASSSSAVTPSGVPGSSGGAGMSSASPRSSQPQPYYASGSLDLDPYEPSKKDGPPRSPDFSASPNSTSLVRASPSPGIMERTVSHPTALNAIPACFARIVPPPSSAVTYEPLPRPYVIHGKAGKRYLDEVFTVTPIPAFQRHDILAEDWIQFLEDVCAVARFNVGQKAVAGALVVTRYMTFIGRIISKAAENGMKKSNKSHVVALLDLWNERFFSYRRLSVILCKGDYRESGVDRDLPAPDRPHVQARPMGHREYSSSSSSSSGSDYDGHDGKSKSQHHEERRARRRAHREERRARREERRAPGESGRSERKAKGRESYRLVVVSTN